MTELLIHSSIELNLDGLPPYLGLSRPSFWWFLLHPDQFEDPAHQHVLAGIGVVSVTPPMIKSMPSWEWNLRLHEQRTRGSRESSRRKCKKSLSVGEKPYHSLSFVRPYIVEGKEVTWVVMPVKGRLHRQKGVGCQTHRQKGVSCQRRQRWTLMSSMVGPPTRCHI